MQKYGNFGMEKCRTELVIFFFVFVLWILLGENLFLPVKI